MNDETILHGSNSFCNTFYRRDADWATHSLDVKSTKSLGIVVKVCPITNGLRTKLFAGTAKRLCQHFQDTAKTAWKNGEKMIKYNCETCQGKFPDELEIVER